MDVLADVLAVTRFSNTALCQEAFTSPWGIFFEPAKRATFHIVSRGSCWLMPGNGDKPIHMTPGDVVLVASGKGHALADTLETPVKHFLEVINKNCSLDSATDNSTLLFCGGYYFEQDGPHPLLSLLPHVIYLPADEAHANDDLQSLVRLMMRERCRSQSAPGSTAVITRLMDVLFVFIVRAWLETQPDVGAGWLGALRDPFIGKALSLVHESPQQRWTVDSLAKEVSLSRAAFAKRFSKLVGEAPVTYLRRWRMDLASRLLKESSDAIAAIAAQVGYESETTFSKTFRQSRGISPGRYRNQFRDS